MHSHINLNFPNHKTPLISNPKNISRRTGATQENQRVTFTEKKKYSTQGTSKALLGHQGIGSIEKLYTTD